MPGWEPTFQQSPVSRIALAMTVRQAEIKNLTERRERASTHIW